MDELDRQGQDARALGGLKLAAIGPAPPGLWPATACGPTMCPRCTTRPSGGLACRPGAGCSSSGRRWAPALTEAWKGVTFPMTTSCYRTVYENPCSDELRAAVESGAAGSSPSPALPPSRGLSPPWGRTLTSPAWWGLYRGADRCRGPEARHPRGGGPGRPPSTPWWNMIFGGVKKEEYRNFIRPRRLRGKRRGAAWCRETRLSPDSLIYPHLRGREPRRKRPIEALPGQFHYGLDAVCEAVADCVAAGVTQCILFGLPARRTPAALRLGKHGVVQQAIRAIKAKYPDFYVVTDVCMCEYTDHGHCGILCGATRWTTTRPWRCWPRPPSPTWRPGRHGGPSDMMDGRVAAIRAVLDENGYQTTPIMAYFRQVRLRVLRPLPGGGGLRALLRGPEGLPDGPPQPQGGPSRSAPLDEEEGADILMVKPALSYLDIIRECSDAFDLPMCAYWSRRVRHDQGCGAAGLVTTSTASCARAPCPSSGRGPTSSSPTTPRSWPRP